MIPAEARRMMDMHTNTARVTESDAVAEANISILVGMIGYAAVCGHISPEEHAGEWDVVRLVRDERSAARRVAA